MRKTIVALALTFLVTAPALGAATAEGEVLAAQDLWKQAMLKKDAATFDKVFHPDLTYGHSSGLVETKAQAIKHVLGGEGTYQAINFSDTRVHVQGSTAMVSGKVEYREHAHGKDSSSNLVVLSVWVKDRGGWQMIARQATKPTPPATPAATAKK
jgi:ketosteroid isomerase-like protein